jgi:tetratricopeptide (TPR) repeat protein
MQKVRRICITLLLLFSGHLVFSQNRKVDSLYELLKADKEDTGKIDHLCRLAFELRNSDPPKVLELARQAQPLIQKFNYIKGEAEMLNWQGMACMNLGRNEDAEKFFSEAKALALSNGNQAQVARSLLGFGLLNLRLGHYEKSVRSMEECLRLPENATGDPKFVINMHNCMGNALKGIGNYQQAISHMLLALKKSTLIGDKTGAAAAYNNLGTVYQNEFQYQESLSQYQKAIPLNTETGNKNWLANNYVNVGLIYFGLAENPLYISQMQDKKSVKEYLQLALQNYSLSLDIKRELGKSNEIADIINNIGLLEMYEAKMCEQHNDRGGMKEKLNNAVNHFRQIIPIRIKSGDHDGLSKAYINLADVNIQLKNIEQAKSYLNKTVAPLRETGSKEEWKSFYAAYAVIDSLEKNYRAAFAHFKLYTMYKDSITNEADTKRSIQLRMNYQFEVERTADSLKTAQRETTERMKHEQELHQQRVYTYGGVAGFALMLIVAIVAIKAYRQKQSANTVISMQKHMVEVKQKAILDSIFYAQRIQNSLLPHDKYIERKLESLKSKKDKNIKTS